MQTSSELESNLDIAFQLRGEKRYQAIKALLVEVGVDSSQSITKREALRYIKEAIRQRCAAERGISPGVIVTDGNGEFPVLCFDCAGYVRLDGRSGNFNPLSLTVVRKKD